MSLSEKITDMFINVDKSIQKLARVIFYIALIVGISLMIIGVFRTFGRLIEEEFSIEWVIEGFKYCTIDDGEEYYFIKVMFRNGFYLALSSLAALPLYGFGYLIELAKEIKKKII